MPTLSLIFSNGFEEGDFSAWTGVTNDTGTPESSVIAAAARSGSYGAKLRMTGVWGGSNIWIYKTVSGSPKWVRVTAYVKMVEGERLYQANYLRLKTAAGENLRLHFGAYNIGLDRANGSTYDLYANIEYNTWYKVILEYDQYNNILKGEVEGVVSGSTYPATSEAITEFQLVTAAAAPYPATDYWDDASYYDETGPPPPPPPSPTTITSYLDCK
jgi:hypothetical protein